MTKIFFIILFLLISYSADATENGCSNKQINPEVQIQNNGWIKIVGQYVKTMTAEEFYKVTGVNFTERDKGRIIKKITVALQFLKPCKATTLAPDIGTELTSRQPLSPEGYAYLTLMASGSADSEEKRMNLFEEYEAICKKSGINSSQFLTDVSHQKFRCDYRTRIFITSFTRDGYEIRTESEYPLALPEDSVSESRKIDMLPGEKTFISFILPDDATSWCVWVPK